MELRQLKTFTVVAEQLSFTKAADQLFMAQSSVSAQIRALEEELVVQLFDRIGRRVMLTDAGQRLLDYARRMVGMTEEIRAEVAGAGRLRGRLTVRVPETLATVYMPEIVDRYHAAHPAVSLALINCSDRRLQEELNSGRIDLAFVMTDAVHMGDVNVEWLRTEPLVLAAGTGHPLAGRETVSLTDLDGRLVLLPKTD